MRSKLALVLHLGGVGECGRLIWVWSVQAQGWMRTCTHIRNQGIYITFSHYKAVKSHWMLSAMHAAYLTVCAQCGIPLYAGELDSPSYWRR